MRSPTGTSTILRGGPSNLSQCIVVSWHCTGGSEVEANFIYMNSFEYEGSKERYYNSGEGHPCRKWIICLINNPLPPRFLNIIPSFDLVKGAVSVVFLFGLQRLMVQCSATIVEVG